MQEVNSSLNTDTASAVPLSFIASNITGTQTVPIEVNGGLSVRAVTDSIVDRMALSDDVGWGLRDDESSVYLDDTQPIGEQITPGTRVTLTPRTHLGAAAG